MQLKKISKSVHLWLPLSGLLLFFLLTLLLMYVNYGSLSLNFDWIDLLREGLLILVQLISTMYFLYFSMRFFDKRFSGKEFVLRYYIYELLFVIIVGFGINFFFHQLFVQFIVIPEEDMQMLQQRLVNMQEVSQTMLLLMYGLLIGFRIYKNLQQKQLELLQWQKEFAEKQFEALKNQLNPHFLFNSLSVLTSLVYADENKAELFIEKLSKTYRYLLDQREKEAVQLSLELDFLNNFKFLTLQRYGDKLQITENIQNDAQKLFLLPHTLLIILEYIIGSNSMSLKKPLCIDVVAGGHVLLLRHSMQPKALQTMHLYDQFTSLKSHYSELKKDIEETTDELTRIKTIKIPLLHANEK